MPTGGEEVEISQGGLGIYTIGDKSSFGVYHRFTQDDLIAINYGTLTQVVFAPAYFAPQIKPGHTYTIQIYKGGVWGEVDNRNPGTLISSQELNNDDLLFNKENTITLENPVTIDAAQELWVGYFCTNIDSILDPYKYPAGCDAVPHNEGLGNIIFYQNQWQTLFEVSSSTNRNFCIKGKVQTIEGVSVNIYCNAQKIDDNISGVTYFHSNPTGEENCYTVEVNCLEGEVSPLSNEVCIEGVGISGYEQSSTFTVYPNPTNGQLTIDNGQLIINNVEIFDVYGKKCHVINSPPSMEGWQPKADGVVFDISHLQSGIYFVKIKTDTETITKKLIKY
jgi:hypothetical protein